MSKSANPPVGLRFWLAKGWVQWVLAAVFFFLVSWVYMGSAVSSCSTATAALGSDSTGGFAWMQWAGGNDLSWGHTNKSNYPFGESLSKPQYVTSAALILVYKLFSSLTTPICGLNLIVLLGYMSTALMMYGLVRWLLKRNEIALFAGFAAGFVPFHEVKAQSHINYVFGSTFIAIIWAYLWLIRKPTYKKALLLSAISAIGFYFDGYFVLITAVLLAGLFTSSFAYDLLRAIPAKAPRRDIWNEALARAKYLVASAVFLALLLMPILITYHRNSTVIQQSLATARSSIKGETELYGARPIEFVLPSYNSALVPAKYVAWRATKLHGSNFSESTLYMGYTVIILAAASLFYLLWRKDRATKLQGIPYVHLVFMTVFVFLACFAFSLPALVTLFGHTIRTPVDILVKLTSNWRVLSRFFLAMDPLVILAASLGLYMLTKDRSRNVRLAVVALCGLVLFLEYLPAPLHPTGDLYRNAPPIYTHLRKDPDVKLVAEYPLASFADTPAVFTFQPVDNKTLLNANDSSISRGPFDASIAGLNDTQTLGVLKRLNVDVIITHGFTMDNPGLADYYDGNLVRGADNKINVLASLYAYTIRDSVAPRDVSLIIKKGYESLAVDDQQISHRYVTNQATMGVSSVNFSRLAKAYDVGFGVASNCPATPAQVTVVQAGKTMWSGSVGTTPVPVSLTVNTSDFYIKTANCAVGITNMSADPV